MLRLPRTEELQRPVVVAVVLPAKTPVLAISRVQAQEPDVANRDEEGDGGEVDFSQVAALAVGGDERFPTPASLLRGTKRRAPEEDGDVVRPPAGSAAIEVEE